MSIPTSIAPVTERFCYADKSSLQDVSVYMPRPLPEKQSEIGYWVIQILCDGDPRIASDIIAYASINYRLTSHPNFPQDPLSVEPTKYRNAKHPDHLDDVVHALAFLQAKYSFGQRYILVGHSCGATLAFQTVMKSITGVVCAELAQPLAIVGVSGIYDLRLLRDTHEHPAYQQFTEDAFGGDEEIWDRVSPAKVQHGGVVEGWSAGKLAMLASSNGDELVDPPQLKAMAEVLDQWKTHDGPDGREVLIIDDLEESHDDIWKNGVELAKVISKTIEALQRK
ncbi:predicted protein [Uncinocarpus reesii 1704]|uniref:Kynurenine formamidase n=1 Tax=Uncinocarpus reesii (strain UAMH 1704) TaxID=336963 RepID=C4JQW4_UNCRE|nr:uncharacterized protein UREG_03446 [Uncinocarpus reesii 1704]EEP78600.1 predicted protein [Uncinocarpus reesii 1704]